jgi:transmembrane sensor
MTEKGNIVMLIRKHFRNELTEDERSTLNNWIGASNENKKVFNELTNEDSLLEAMQEFYTFTRNYDRGQSATVVSLYRRKQNWFKYMLATAVVFAAVCLVWLFVIDKNKKQVAVTDTATKKATPDIPPGGNKAVLILEDGSTIELDDARNGVIAEQGKMVINKKDGELVYNEAGKQVKNNITSWNTVKTPRGGQYQLSLPDGSKVWLNAASSLKFPVSFSGKNRVVQLEGEAYFDVVHNESMPFEVQLYNGAKVQVLGTRFNIMAYDEEAELKTTLVQGKVKMLSVKKQEALLQPGQQALLNKLQGALQVDKDADIGAAVAWKEGMFKFARTDLRAVMRQLARWYDVQIEYDKNLAEKYFSGEISRRLNAAEVLSVIEFAGVHFKIEGKKIIVLP